MTHADDSQSANLQGQIDLGNPLGLRHWCEVFGVTIEQLQESVQAVGSDAAAVRRHLLEQGSSAGAG